jgi:hypothetical protein
MTVLNGGEALERRLAEISKDVRIASTLRVGFLEGATYPDGTSVALVAAVNEFGAPSRNQPPRPFFRNMIAAKSGEWPEAIANLLVANNYNARKTLEIAGEAIKGQLKDSILNGQYAPLTPATIARKGFDTPLIDTSTMINSIDKEVK